MFGLWYRLWVAAWLCDCCGCMACICLVFRSVFEGYVIVLKVCLRLSVTCWVYMCGLEVFSLGG